jgi:hypothetical protein
MQQGGLMDDGHAANGEPPHSYIGAIDCDLHPAVPGMGVLMPYLDDRWSPFARSIG